MPPKLVVLPAQPKYVQPGKCVYEMSVEVRNAGMAKAMDVKNRVAGGATAFTAFAGQPTAVGANEWWPGTTHFVLLPQKSDWVSGVLHLTQGHTLLEVSLDWPNTLAETNEYNNVRTVEVVVPGPCGS